MIKSKLPQVIFKTRVREDLNTTSEFVWKDLDTEHYFANTKAILFSLPGAFTPICSTLQLPSFEQQYSNFQSFGINRIYCVSVNDSFVMNSWFESLKIKNISAIPDGSGEFTRKMGMLVKKDNLGFGMRSWRYSAFIDNCEVVKIFVEEGKNNESEDDDPFKVSDVWRNAFIGDWLRAILHDGFATITLMLFFTAIVY